ncbi:MAG TPA: class I SAM-dependent methyltransferase [Solirubrobacteraceae bacterium]|nr:class I SAM-dependent methyltransferase [Solirubrobacteraceae bacterium]
MAPSLPRRACASLRLRALDALDGLRPTHPRRAARVPPRRLLAFVGDSDFVATGDEFMRHFVELGELRPDERVLDVGCGIGRMARPLAAFLGPGGSYDGFDVHAEGVAWCRERYADLPAFGFAHADVRNAVYNPGGAADAAAHRFPYEDGSFHFVFATSVLTHLTAPAARRYVGEMARVLAPGGRLLATAFALDDAARTLIAQGRSALRLHELDDVTAVADLAVPERAVAFDRDWLLEAIADAGLAGAAMHPGTWCGRADGVSFQDVVVARRPRPGEPRHPASG